MKDFPLPRISLSEEEMRNRARGEKYADRSPPVLSTGECFKIINNEKIFRWRSYSVGIFYGEPFCGDKDENETLYLPIGW